VHEKVPIDLDSDTYTGPRSDNEYNRLRLQHEFIKYFMNGKLLTAPLDKTSSSLRVLDSATGDGYWLSDLANELPQSTVLVGADIAPQHFLTKQELPANVTLINHNIFTQWPSEYRSSFDLVHQRFVLMACNDENSVTAIKYLFDCVKPGGWIQLHDGDMNTIEEGPEHAAMMRFREVARAGFTMMGFNPSPGPKLVNWLHEAGAVDVQEEVLTIKCGRRSPDASMGRGVINMLVSILDNMLAMTGKLSDFPQHVRQRPNDF
jgi:SAM-dependent methyltransferase